MEFKATISYEHFLYLTQNARFMESVSNLKIIGKPDFLSAGMAGYIETKISCDINYMKDFADEYEGFWSLSDEVKTEYRKQIGKQSC